MRKDLPEIQIGNQNFIVINLTEPLRLETEVYPGDPKPARETFSDIKKTGWQHYVHCLGDHVFHPHADAPSHQNPGLQDRGIEFFGKEYEFNRAFMVDLSDSKRAQTFDGIKYLIEVRREDIEKYSQQLSEVGALIIRTGYDRWLEENKKHTPENLPYLSEDAATYIASFKNLKVIAIDSLTIDPVGKHTAHQILTKDRMVVESLVYLSDIEKRVFDLQTSPLRIVGATGCPVIANAFILKD